MTKKLILAAALLLLTACSPLEPAGNAPGGNDGVNGKKPEGPTLPVGAPFADTYIQPSSLPSGPVVVVNPRGGPSGASWVPEREIPRPATWADLGIAVQRGADLGAHGTGTTGSASGNTPTAAPTNPSTAPIFVDVRYEMPAIGSEAFKQMVKDTPLSTLLALLEEKAKQDDDFITGETLAGALIGHATSQGGTFSDSWKKADKLADRMKIKSEIDAQWLRLQRAQLERLAGEPQRSLRELRDACDQAVRDVPPVIVDMYFCVGGKDLDEQGFDKRRKLDDGRPNDVYGRLDEIYVAYQFQYFTGIRSGDSDRYGYKIETTAELFDEAEPDITKARMTSFLWDAVNRTNVKTAETTRGRSPDEIEAGRWSFKLPNDIKTNHDYRLRLTFRDMNADGGKGRALAPQELIIKVR